MRQLTRITWLLYWRPRHVLTILIDRKESAVAWLDLFMQIFGIFTHRVTICININCYLSVFMVERKITSDRFVWQNGADDIERNVSENNPVWKILPVRTLIPVQNNLNELQ